MAISLKGTAGAWAGGTTTAAPTIPTHAAGDKLLVFVGAKPTLTATPPTFSTPSGWTKILDGHNNSGALQGLDAGQTWFAVYERTAAGSGTTISVSVTNGNTNLSQALVFQRTSSSYTWDTVTAVLAGDTSSGTAFSIADTLTIGANDMIAVGTCLAGNNVTYGATWSYSATGMTFGTVTKTTDGTTNNGNDLAASSSYGLVTAGTSASVTLTAANTLSGSQTGVGIMVRLREIAPTPPVASFTVTPNPASDELDVLTLDATASSATSPATISSYAWSVLNAPGNYFGAFADATDPTTTLTPAAVNTAYQVTGSGALNGSGDNAINTRLTGLGYTVTLIDDAAAVPTDDGRLVVFCESCSSSQVGSRWNNWSGPMITLEYAVADDWGFGPSTIVDATLLDTTWNVVDTDAGTSTGVKTHTSADTSATNLGTLLVADLVGGLDILVERDGSSTGAVLVRRDSTTGPKRAVLAWFDHAYNQATSDGWAVFDAQVAWTALTRSWIIRLTVTDSNGMTDTEDVTVPISSAPTVTAVLDAPLGALTAAVAATPDHPATLAAPLGALTSAITATVTHPATLAAPLGALTSTITAVVTHIATFAAPLGALTGSMAAAPVRDATFAAPLGALTAAAAAAPQRDATLAAPLGALTGTITATPAHVATFAAPLGQVTAAFSASIGDRPPIDAVFAAPLGSVTGAINATVIAVHNVTLAAGLGGLVASIVSTVEHDTHLEAELGQLVAAINAVVVLDSLLAAPLGGLDAHLIAFAYNPAQVGTDGRVLYVGAEVRLLLVAAEVRSVLATPEPRQLLVADADRSITAAR